MVNFKTVALTAAIATSVAAYDIPANLQRLYNAHKPGKCSNKLLGGLSPGVGSGDTSFAYCGDINGAIYIHSQRNGGQYADMDTDCDGANNAAGDCSNDPTGQGTTAFKDQVSKYGIKDLDANLHAYVVYGNKNFNPEDHGMKPLSVMAIVCNNQLHYGVWGDTNGANTVGEASLALAQICFPNEGLNGDKGHGGLDVMYIGFTGSGTVPTDANWKASTRGGFTSSLKARGDKLVAALGG